MNRKLALLLPLLPLLAACTQPGNGIDATQDRVEAEKQAKNCADPKWKEQHLGIWYSVCRPNEAVR